MALYREDGTEIADRAALDALTEAVPVDQPVKFTEAVYEDFDYPKSTDTSLAPGEASAGTGRRLKYANGQEVPTSTLDTIDFA